MVVSKRLGSDSHSLCNPDRTPAAEKDFLQGRRRKLLMALVVDCKDFMTFLYLYSRIKFVYSTAREKEKDPLETPPTKDIAVWA